MSALRDLHLGRGRVVPAGLLSVQYARSQGPGGQNVQKTSTKVDLRLCLASLTTCLTERDLHRLLEVLGPRLDREGRLQVVSQEHRERPQNLEAAMRRMELLLRQALVPLAPRVPTRPTRGSQRRRLDEKRRQGDKKRDRRDDGG